jgi:hypothetical protein
VKSITQMMTGTAIAMIAIKVIGCPPRLMMAAWRNSIKKPAYRQNRPYREFRTLPDPAPCPGYAKYIFANGQQERSVKRERKEISRKGQYLSKAIPFSPG